MQTDAIEGIPHRSIDQLQDLISDGLIEAEAFITAAASIVSAWQSVGPSQSRAVTDEMMLSLEHVLREAKRALKETWSANDCTVVLPDRAAA